MPLAFVRNLVLSLVFFALTPAIGICSDTDPAAFQVSVAPSPVHTGEVAIVKIRAEIDPGWHLYGLVPTPQPGPTPTSIVVSGPGLILAGSPSEDKATTAFDPNFEKDVHYHERSADFSVPARVTAAPGSASATVTIRYQTCNSSICLPPRTKVLSVPIVIVVGAVRSEYRDAPVSHTASGQIGLFLLAAFGAGLFALVTPCVFPLIPITLTSFVKQADGDKGRLVRIALGYSLGIVILYIAVGAITSLVLGAGGVDKLAANPYINLFAFAVFVVFALSFFEAIQITLPGNLGVLQSAAKKQGGWVGLALLGVVFVVASFTCTAPFIGTLLVAAAGGELLKPLLGMLVFAVAFVSPFVVFSFFPQWITRIPRSGVWLARVKASLGFIELAAALKFLSNADLVWQWKVLTQPVLLASWAVISVCASLYLFGLLRFGIVAETEPYGAKVSVARLTFASIFLGLAGCCFWGISGRPISPVVAAFLPPVGYGTIGVNISDGLPWLNDYGAALASARAESKPLLIDFTGYTCTNCRLNEKQVFPNPIVQRELDKFVRVQLYTDGGRNAAQNEALQLSKFGDVALPLYGVVDPISGDVVGKTAGVQSVAGFASFLMSTEAPVQASTQTWAPYSEAEINAAIAEDRPIIIDFTAQWCTNCKAIERNVFTQPSVSSKLPEFSTFRCDMSNFYSPTNEALQKRYSIASLPAIVFIGADGREVPGTRISGLVTTTDFLSRMSRALLP